MPQPRLRRQRPGRRVRLRRQRLRRNPKLRSPPRPAPQTSPDPATGVPGTPICRPSTRMTMGRDAVRVVRENCACDPLGQTVQISHWAQRVNNCYRIVKQVSRSDFSASMVLLSRSSRIILSCSCRFMKLTSQVRQNWCMPDSGTG